MIHRTLLFSVILSIVLLAVVVHFLMLGAYRFGTLGRSTWRQTMVQTVHCTRNRSITR